MVWDYMVGAEDWETWTWNQQGRKGFPRQGAQERSSHYDLPDTFNFSLKINAFSAWHQALFSFIVLLVKENL